MATAGGPQLQHALAPQLEYVIGFMFSAGMQLVLLIRKNRPDWQAGRLNGIGGKIEPGEAPIDAMIREFKEETGLLYRSWLPFHRERFRNGVVLHFFAAATAEIDKAHATTDEELVIVPVAKLPATVVDKLVYAIPMAQQLLPEAIDNLPVLESP